MVDTLLCELSTIVFLEAFAFTSYLFTFLSSKQETVVAHQLTHQYEGINSGNAVGDQTGNHLALSVGRLWGSKTTPDVADLTGLLLDVILELGFSRLDFFERIVIH